MASESKPRVVALFSGGLDSSLAILLMLKQGLDVHAITFLTHFGCDVVDRSSCSGDPYPIAEQFGFSVRLHHLGEEFIKIVANPKWGHGKNMNPCIDCRILMLNHAKYVMEQIGAVAIATGEVLGQRPMSQTRDRLNLVEKQTGLRGRLLRPLSAKLLKPTIPEQEGIIDRSRLENINGRSRKRQMELADKLGLEHYPTPAAGCLLTDVNYSRRLSDLLAHSQSIDFNMLNLLRVGRHFRFSPTTKIVIGRKEIENHKIEKYRRPEDVLLEAQETGSPLTLVQGETTDDAILFAARATARYSDDKGLSKVRVTVTSADRTEVLEVCPIGDEEIERIRL